MPRNSIFRRSAALAAVVLLWMATGAAQDPPRESPPRTPRQPRGTSSDTTRRAPVNTAQRQNPGDIIPLPPRPPRERFHKFIPKLRSAATVPPARRGVAVAQNGGYPELRVDGSPFFVHSGEFPYPRIPRDLWAVALDNFRQIGINTIAISVAWNFHEPQQGQLDFEGRSNPRRDLRLLLRLIAEREFKLIVRLGPRDLLHWPDGGYPKWLLTRPEHKLAEGAMALPRANPDAPPAANQDALQVAFLQSWMPQLFRELAAYSPRASMRIPQVALKRGDPTEKEISGPLLLIQASSTRDEYLEEIRKQGAAAGLESVLLFTSAAYARSLSTPAMGQWFFAPEHAPAFGDLRSVTIPIQQLEAIEPAVSWLAMQPDFPPMMIEYQAGGPAPPLDTRPLESPPANTLVSSRLLLAHGLRGINHSPLMDGITPAGYEVRGVNRYARWDAAFSADADAQPRARAVARTGQLLETWDQFLGGSHKRADFGVVFGSVNTDYGRSSLSPILAIAAFQRAATAVGLSTELLDPGMQPVEQLLRHALLLAPVAESDEPQFTEAEQRALLEYVRGGGTLAFFPRRPVGEILQPLWQGHSEPPGGGAIATAVRKFGQGTVIEAIQPPDRVTLPDADSSNIARALGEFLHRAGLQRIIERKDSAREESHLVVTQLASNAGSQPLSGRTGGMGMLSVTNLGEVEASQRLRIVPPKFAARTGLRTQLDRVDLNVTVPAGESLLLPLSFPLCSAAREADRCTDEVIASGAELLRVERDGKTLELTMYVPAKATLLLRLAEQPSRVRVDETGPQGAWIPGQRTFEVEILRGASPDYIRVVKVYLRYTPFVPEKPDREKPTRRDYDFAVTDAVRLPLAADASLPSYPPLVVLDGELSGRFILEVKNYDEMGRDVDVKVEGPVVGSDGMGVDGGELRHERVDIKPASGVGRGNGSSHSTSDALLEAEMEVRSGRDTRRSPIRFLPVAKDAVSAYRFDFDRDSADEWALEDNSLRLAVSPESGGRIVAVVNKDSGLSLTNSVGMMRDSLNGADLSLATYTAAWVKEEKATALRLNHTAADGSQVEKTLRVTAPQEFEVSYRVEAAAAATAAEKSVDWLSTASSVPVVVHRERTTRFCWPRNPPPPEKAAEPVAEEDLRCEVFVAGGRVEIPAQVTALQVRTPGSFAQRLNWQGAPAGTAMVIEMKQYTALLRLRVARPAAGAAAFTLKYLVIVAE